MQAFQNIRRFLSFYRRYRLCKKTILTMSNKLYTIHSKYLKPKIHSCAFSRIFPCKDTKQLFLALHCPDEGKCLNQIQDLDHVKHYCISQGTDFLSQNIKDHKFLHWISLPLKAVSIPDADFLLPLFKQCTMTYMHHPYNNSFHLLLFILTHLLH